MRYAALVFVGLLAGCSTPLPVTRIVHVKSIRYVPIPTTLLVPCPLSDLSSLKTNGDLLDALLDDQAALKICNGQLEGIRTLAPPPGT